MSAEKNAAPNFTNRLAREKSPYLLQHQHNPVDWYAWGEEAFASARAQDKPVFLSVGYSACHWCHVMEHESFEDEATARLLNEHFVSIKVDREERPDVDEIYMTAVQMMTRHGGWPMSVFLTPDGRPFYGGTYFPPEDRAGRIGFKSLLREMASAYRDRREEVEQAAQNAAEALREATRQRPAPAPAGLVDPDALLARAVAQLSDSFDDANGGFGQAPKFPPHHSLALLLEVIRRGGASSGYSPSLMLTRTLDAMGLGGVYDQIGGGFHRYSTDDHWLLPHFEKMLYDNALLARVYADAYVVTGRDAYARIARETCDWVLRDMTDAGGGFHAALDADSEGEEGKFYVWAVDEIRQALGDEAAGVLSARYNLLPRGNFHDEATGRPTGTNIPHLSGPELPTAIDAELAEGRAKLLQARNGRVPPGKDDKVITSWNGLMIGGLAFAGKALGEARYVEAAARAADFCLTTLRPQGKLLRRYRDGEAAFDAYLEDFAFLADGLLDLHDATGDGRWADAARSLADTLLSDFWDPEDGGFFFTGTGHESLIARSKDLFDGALPSPNGVAARVLARLGALPGGETYGERAREMLRAFHGVIHRVPHGTQTLVLAAGMAYAQNDGAATASPPAEVVTLHIDGPPLRVAAGGSATAVFLLTVAPGWHVNAHRVPEEHLLPTVATLTTDLPAAVGPVRHPAPVAWSPDGDAASLPTYQGASRFEVPLQVAPDAEPGRYRVGLRVRFQPCGESSCLPPDERTAEVTVEVA